MSDYKVGQELWWEGTENRPIKQAVTITKIGAKYLTLSNGERVFKATLIGEPTGFGYGYAGQCYLSREARETELLLLKGWRDLARKMQLAQTAPDGVSFEQIGQAAELLGLGAL